MHIAIAMYVFLMDLAMFLNCDHDENDVPTLINCGSSQRGAEHGTYCPLQELEQLCTRWVRLCDGEVVSQFQIISYS